MQWYNFKKIIHWYIKFEYLSSTFIIIVNLTGGNRSSEGIVIAINPLTGIEGPICGEDWDLKDVS